MSANAAISAAAIEFARGFNHNYYQPLHIAILKGDWESSKAFLDRDPSACTAKVTVFGMTVLHVAAVGGQWQLIEKLIPRVPAESLAELDLTGSTCLHYVAMGGGVKAAKALVAKSPSLTQAMDFSGYTPLMCSVSSPSCKEMAWYLALNTTNEQPTCQFSGPLASKLVAFLTATGYHDITMFLIRRYPDLAMIMDSNGSIILEFLSKRPADFQSGNKFGLLDRFIYHCVSVESDHLPRGDFKDSNGHSSHHDQSYFGVPRIKRVRDAKLRQVFSVRLVEYVCSQALAVSDSQFWQSFLSVSIIFNSASSGIVEILRIIFRFFPDLVGAQVPNQGNIAQIAIKNRQEKVFSLIREMPVVCKILVSALDESENTTSHVAARYAFPLPASISGGAFRMQRELQWFKEVEKLDHPLHMNFKNQDRKTAWQVFKEEHKDCREEAEKWMKDTSNSCMIVATLIATVVFAAVITVPGGNNQDKGFPIFLEDKTKFPMFVVFAVSDALALFSSVASLIMFLSVLTAPYSEEDFLKTLPQRLILGLASLFFAIVTTMVAFGAALSLVLSESLKWVPIPITVLACVPVALFAMLQLPLFMDMIVSTYASRIYHP